MKTKVLWALLMAGFAMGGCWAQEKQPSKQEQPAAPAAAPQAPHTYNISREDKERKNPVRFTDFSAERGKKLFQTQCAMCHGKDADGKGELVEDLDIHPPDFTKPDVLGKRTDGELFAIMGEGSEKMPGQNKRMTERQRWQIVNYLRVVQGKTPAKATEDERAEEGTVVSPH
jgi:mono/diheme cytochrome c family protein